MGIKQSGGSSPFIGKPAPAFTLMDHKNVSVTVPSLEHPAYTVLLFYPGDYTPGCTLQLCDVRDTWDAFRTNGIIVYGINHGSASSHRRFARVYRFPFPLLSDPKCAVSEQYDAVRVLFGVQIIKRVVVCIDVHGCIVYYRVGMPKASDIVKSIHSSTHHI